ncbi:aa3-type cytochrome c oxidase subunit IV [Sphingomonas lenta]|uniref:Aa3-type cytochrome c oxidase subunit IV n=1 Tax=Sphingomonas lenta TaxID=1141887 RepID=A0A2A2SER4_9SPHN|nr:aa3-type cytochrome c oxidase subunit IV [Sphingomonas lenta]PAX07672.1 aa3-type cytochrome c oxidase subunit IV [Sphingomonas lenta]
MAHNDDLKSHERTYHRIMAMLKWGTVATAVIAAIVIWLISG